jgi:hypothetical protein
MTGFGVMVGITAIVGFKNSNFCWYFLLINLESFEKILKVYLLGENYVTKLAIGVI